MRKPVVIALAIAVAVLLGSTVMLYQKNQQTTAALTETQQAEVSARTNYADAFNSIAEIQDSLNAISVKDDNVRLEQQSERLTQPNREQVLASISRMNASIQRTKERIGLLETQLGKKGVQVAGLNRLLSNQKKLLAEKQEEVAALTTRVDSLQVAVAGLQTTVSEAQDTIVAKNQVIDEKQRELGTIYYVVGTKKDLAESGVITAKGGVLGVGKTIQLTGRLDESKFTPLNTDQENVIRAPGAKVRVLSAQPVTSYEIRQEGNVAEIHILDPVEFRKVKHLVIMTA